MDFNSHLKLYQTINKVETLSTFALPKRNTTSIDIEYERSSYCKRRANAYGKFHGQLVIYSSN